MPPLLWSVVVAAVAVIAIAWTGACLRRPHACVVVVLGLAVFSSHLLAALYQAGPPASLVRSLIPVKDVAAGLLVCALLWRSIHAGDGWRWLVLPSSALVLVAVIGFQSWDNVSGRDLSLSVRDMVVPILGLLSGLLLRTSERRIAARWSVLMIGAGAVYAIVEYFLPLGFVRDTVGVGQYWSVVKEQGFQLSGQGTGLPGNFLTSSGSRRLSGTFGDPLAAGYALSVGLILAVLVARSRTQIAAGAVTAMALALTFTRAGFLIAFLSIAPIGIQSVCRGGRKARRAAVLGVLAMVVAVFAVPAYRTYVSNIFTGQDDSTKAHLNAILQSPKYSYTWLGEGFGLSGSAVGRGTESVLVAVALQVGVVGVVLYLVALGWLLLIASRRWRGVSQTPVFVGLVVGLGVSMILSEQLLTFNAGWVLMFLIGLAPPRAPVMRRDLGTVSAREGKSKLSA